MASVVQPSEALAPPPSWAVARQVWHRLTARDVLFSQLAAGLPAQVLAHEHEPWSEAVARHSLEDLLTSRRALGTAWWWKTCYVNQLADPKERSDAQRRWEILARLLWCFEASCAAGTSSGAVSVVADRVPTFTESGIQAPSEGPRRHLDVEWAHLGLRSLREPTPLRRLSVPVVLWQPSDEEGRLCTLDVDVFPRGAGCVSSDPRFPFDTTYHGEFTTSMGVAWRAAVAAAAAAGVDGRWDGRWRLRPGWPSPVQDPLETVDGRSASGAAARAWWYAINDKVVDPGVIVLAQVTESGHLAGVDGLAPKVRALHRLAALQRGRAACDTILVVGADNEAEALAALSGDATADPRLHIERLD